MKSVFITGATTNTGLGIAHKFAKEGYAVFIGSRSGEQATETAEMLKEKYGVFSKGYDMIVGDEDNVNEVFDDINNLGYPVDAVVLNAANLGICQEFLTVDIKDFADVINTNICWNFMIVRAAAKQMIGKGSGSVVFINSNTAYRAIPDRIAYSASRNKAYRRTFQTDF